MGDERPAATHRQRIALAAVTVAMAFGASGCLEDGDCGVCNERSLELQIISGTNYAGELVHLVSPTCEGDKCPEPFSEARRFVETIGLCDETDAALGAGRGPHEFCRIAPIVVSGGLQFVFNNLLEPTSVELVRKRPNLPNLFETYDWKVDILRVDGPISRYSGDWRSHAGDDTHRMTRFVNRSCIDNMPAGTFDIETTDCNVLVDGVPRKLQADRSMPATRGAWDDRAVGEASEYDCETPVDGVDTCCSQCDFSLSVQVSKYGAGARIECDPQGDRLVDCAAFVVKDSREDEFQGFVAPEDLLRAMHPNARAEARATVSCTSDDVCRDRGGADLPGAECIGTNASGDACSPEAGDPACTGGLCRAPWFVECRVDPDTTGDAGYCVDVRHDSDAAAGCHVSAEGDRLSGLDGNADGKVTAEEACDDATSCDPVYDLMYEPLSRYERKVSLPGFVRDLGCDGGCGDDCGKCTDRGGCSGSCSDDEAQACAEQYFIAQTCKGDENQTDYAINLVTKLGGVIYDGAIKGILWRPADRGGQPRALIEACAEERGLIAPRNVADGWRANDVEGIGVEFEADWDRALCSGQDYEVVFQPSDEAAHVVDKKGNTLDGKRVYKFRTSQFHIVPSSGFPGDNLRIGACDTFSLKFSNKFDLSPENLNKIEIHDLTDGQPVVVAGGTSCVETRAEVEQTGAVPCLDVDVTDQASGEIHVRVDAVRFEPVLVADRTYGFHVPGIPDPQANNHERLLTAEDYDTRTSLAGLSETDYKAAFWDACGMPLFVSTEVNLVNGPPEGGNDFPVLYPIYDYTFTVDPARCEEDGDGDGVQLSCDNAPDAYNPLQTDADEDGVGDPLDFCPASPEIALDTSDSDRDGVGNACDGCAKSVSRYNDLAASNALSPSLWVRGIPDQRDTDEDGIGDVCDNCPTVANCSAYDIDRPWRLGDAIDPDAATCQRDADFDMVGDECVGTMADDAAGPVGLGATDDFDQDGLTNFVDACPRQPELARVVCDDDDACGAGRRCVEIVDGTGVCNHLDSDDDGVGDLCDTCVHVANAAQVLDGGAQADDDDGDFIGADCEMGEGCDERGSPRPLGFFAVSASGQCCTTLLVEQGGGLVERWNSGRTIVDPAGLPVSASCTGAGCRSLPDVAAATPGVLELPPGCDDALAAAGMTAAENRPFGADDVQGDLDALWNLQCRMSPLDQDYDGLGDSCDLCEFDFDPTNEIYVDEEGRSWPNDGAVCSGGNSLAARCEDEIDGDTGEDDGGSSDGGSSDGGSSTSG